MCVSKVGISRRYKGVSKDLGERERDEMEENRVGNRGIEIETNEKRGREYHKINKEVKEKSRRRQRD